MREDDLCDVFFGARGRVSVVESKLLKRAEFSQMGMVITREPELADVILELHHDRFTK